MNKDQERVKKISKQLALAISQRTKAKHLQQACVQLTALQTLHNESSGGANNVDALQSLHSFIPN